MTTACHRIADNGLVTLRIDTTRALRSHHSHVELVKAIIAAPKSTQETQAVEWKIGIDLTDRGWRAKLAKGVLGFANRDPDVAVRWFEGCAYFVAGASPGELSGTAVFDSAKVEDMLAPYLGKGPAGPEWSSSYIEVDGKSVLVVTVEPPRWGSRIWTLLKEYASEKGEPLRAGDIFVRQHASTERASPADIDMLTRRATATGTRLGGLSIVLKANTAAVPIDIRDVTVAAWLDGEREALKLHPDPPKQPPNVLNNVTLSAAKRKALTVEDILGAANFAGKFTMPDPRTREKYQAELDGYLTKAGQSLPGVLIRSAVRREWGRIDLSLRNDTFDNYHKVEVELYIQTQGVAAFFESREVPGYRLPARPVPFGKGGRSMFDSIGAFRMPSYLNNAVVPSVSANRGSIDNSASSRIRLPHVDVRPKRLAELDTFYLVVHPDLAGTTISASWTATATDASGDMEGAIDIPVMPRLPTTAELLSDTKDDDGDFDFDDE